MNDVSLDNPMLTLNPDVVLFDENTGPFAFINSLSLLNGISIEMNEVNFYTDWFDDAKYAQNYPLTLMI